MLISLEKLKIYYMKHIFRIHSFKLLATILVQLQWEVLQTPQVKATKLHKTPLTETPAKKGSLNPVSD